MARTQSFRLALLRAMFTAIAGVIALTAFLCQGIPLILDPDNVRHIHKLRELDDDVKEIVWRPDGSQVAFVRWEQPVEIRDGRTLEPTRQIGAGKKIIHFAFSPDPSFVAYCENNGVVEILNLQTGNSIELDAPKGQW